MTDGKYYLNTITGELIRAWCRLKAYRYFKADGKICGYEVHLRDVVRYRRRK